MQPVWESSDAWLFAAIAGSANSGPVSELLLCQVIANADLINHAIPTEEEFVQAIGRLTAIAVIGVSEDGGRYWPTAAGLDLRRRWKHGLFGWDVILTGLRQLGLPADVRWALPAGAFAQAVTDYRQCV